MIPRSSIPEPLVGSQVTLKKGVLRQVSPPGPRLPFRFNPVSVKRTPTVGAWRQEERPRQKPAVEWAGQTLETLVFTLRLDGYSDDPIRSVEPEIRVLERFGEKRGKDKPPPELRFDYGPAESRTIWVIVSIEPLDELRNAQLQIVQQEFVITLLEYVEAELALSPVDRHKKNKDKGKGKGGDNGKDDKKDEYRIYTVKRGETLSSIAAKLLGKASRWPEIARLNGLRDPDRIVPGQKLKIPKN